MGEQIGRHCSDNKYCCVSCHWAITMDPLSSPLALDPLPLSVLAILISMTSLSCLLLCIYDNRSFEISTGTRWLTTLCTGHFIFLQLVQLTATLPMNSPYWPFQFPTISSINCHHPCDS